MENKTTEVFGANVERLPLKDLIKRIGPGLIATGIVIGPGAITTAAMLGSNFGYTLIWLIIPDCFYGNYIYDGDKPAGDRDGNADHSCNP